MLWFCAPWGLQKSRAQFCGPKGEKDPRPPVAPVFLLLGGSWFGLMRLKRPDGGVWAFYTKIPVCLVVIYMYCISMSHCEELLWAISNLCITHNSKKKQYSPFVSSCSTRGRTVFPDIMSARKGRGLLFMPRVAIFFWRPLVHGSLEQPICDL